MIIAILSLLFIFSYHKEIIDGEGNSLELEESRLNEKAEEIRSKVLESFEKDNESVWLDYAKSKVASYTNTPMSMSYLSEIVLFLFYLILFFAVTSFLVHKIASNKIIVELLLIAFIILISWIFSFREWSLKLIKILSIEINKKSIKK